MVVKLTRTPEGSVPMVEGKSGAPVCVGDKLTVTKVCVVMFVVLPLDCSAFRFGQI